jgi:hypothetical protein
MTPKAALILTAVANALAVVRFGFLRVARSAPLLTSYLAVLLVLNLLAAFLPVNTGFYQRFYNVGEPLSVLIGILVVRELYRLAFADYPGIASLTKWNTYIALAFAVLFSVAMAAVTYSQVGLNVFTGYVLLWERLVSFTLAAFIAFLMFLLSRYPIVIPRNLAINIVIFTLYFCGTFALSFPSASRNVRLEWFAFYGTETLSIICYLSWGLLLRRQQEHVRIRRKADPDREEQLLNQLSALNRVLSKLLRRRK